MAAVWTRAQSVRGFVTSGMRWCWIVAFASCWINFCVLGVLRSSAVIYVALVDTYHVSREDAAWPLGVFGFCMCVTGAVAGFLNHHFSIRSIVLCGTVIASISVSLCSCATNMTHIVILYGACQGIGVGVIVPLTHVILNHYFVKHRALALGIAYAGSSAGSFAFPPLAQLMVREYGLQGTFLLLGGIMMNSIIGAALFRTPPHSKSPTQSPSLIHPITHAQMYDIIHPSTTSEPAVASQRFPKPQRRTVNSSSVSTSSQSSEEKNHHPINGDDCSVTKHLEIIPTNKSSSSALRTTNTEETVQSNFASKMKLHKQKLKSSFQLAFSIVTNPVFVIISLTFAVYFSGSAIYLMVILDYATDKNMTQQQGVFLVSAFSFGDLAGRLTCGWVPDLHCIQRKVFVMVYIISMGAMFMILPLCTSYEALVAMSVLLGTFNGSIIVNYSVLLTEYLGLQKLSLAMGFSTFIIGATAFARPFLIGHFRDKSLSYDFLFVSLGALQIGITLLWVFQTVVEKIKKESLYL